MWAESAWNLILQSFPTFQQSVTPPLPLGGGRGGGACLTLHSFSCTQIFHSLPPPPRGRSGRGGEGVLGGGGEGVRNYPIFQYSNLLLSNSWKLPWGDLSKWQIYHPHTYTGQLYDSFLLSSLPRGRNRGKLNASVASVPTYARGGARGGAGWVLPWFPSLLSSGRDRGSGDNPYTWHNTYTSYARCPREFVLNSIPTYAE
jgi:hypothetical protein